jgi:2'-5' RNA ligase
MKIKTVPAQAGTVYFCSMNMYFIALIAPEDINRQVLKWKLWMKERYRCEAALKSQAHITLVPPFWMNPELENKLADSLIEFQLTQNCFILQLNHFAHFKPKVIFINVVPNDRLTKLKDDLSGFLFKKSEFPLKKEDRPFHPHVTIATRDLRKKSFYEAWEYFKEKKFEAQWRAHGVSLLRHNKKNWDVIATSRFKSD